MSPWIITDSDEGARMDYLDYSELDPGWVTVMALHGDHAARKYLESLDNGEQPSSDQAAPSS